MSTLNFKTEITIPESYLEKLVAIQSEIDSYSLESTLLECIKFFHKRYVLKED